MTLLGLSVLTVSTCDRSQSLLGYIFRTFSPHCSPGLHSPYIQDSFWIVQYGTLNTRRTNYFLRKSNLVSGSDIPVYQPQPLIIAHTYLKLILLLKFYNHVFCPSVLFTYHSQPNLRQDSTFTVGIPTVKVESKH